MRHLLTTLLLTLCCTAVAQESNKFADELANRIELFSSKQSTELCAVQTSSDKYASGDKIWFTAFIYNNFTKEFNIKSKTITLRLVDIEGRDIVQGRFGIAGAMSSGSLELPRNMSAGQYILAAYPSAISTQALSKLYYKTITIEARRENEKQKTVATPQPQTPQTHKAYISARNSQGRTIVSISAPEEMSGRKVYVVGISSGVVDFITPIELKTAMSLALPPQNTHFTPLYLAIVDDKFELIASGIALRNRSLIPTQLTLSNSEIATKQHLAITATMEPGSAVNSLFASATPHSEQSQTLGQYMDKVAYSDFSWGAILAKDTSKTTHQGLSIGGVVTNDGEPAPDISVNLVHKITRARAVALTDKEGKFYFPLGSTEASEDFDIALSQDTDTRKYKITLDSDFSIDVKRYILEHYYGVDASKLKDNSAFQVPLARVPDNFYYSTYSNMIQLLLNIRPFNISNGKIIFPGTKNSINAQNGALIVLDGSMLGTDIGLLTNISPATVDKVTISTNLIDIQKYTGFNSVGVIEITSLKQNIEPPTAPKNEISKHLDAIAVSDRMEEVSYDKGSKTNRKDERTTLLWNPTLKVTDNEAHDSLWSSDVVGDYAVTVEGITEQGQIVSVRKDFTVK